MASGPVTNHPLWAQEATAGLEAPRRHSEAPVSPEAVRLQEAVCLGKTEARRFGLEVSEQGQAVMEA